MGYTMSYDASIKCKKTDVKGLLYHNARDVDMYNGICRNHSNECIDATRTGYNQTYYYNQETETFEKCTDIEQIYTALKKRLETVKKPLRRDAVVLRSLILQLDPSWYEEHTSEAEWEFSYDCMIEWVCETFGQENIISFSIHEDETNPHIHVSFCPVTPDGRLSQKDFIDKNKLRTQHKSLREFMTEKGFEIEMQNRKPGKYARRMSVDEYKDFAELQSEHENLDSAFQYNVQQQEQLKRKKAELDTREQHLQAKETDFHRRLQAFTEQAEAYRKELLEMADEYWCQPDAEDPVMRFLKTMKNTSTGISLYEVYQKRQEKEKARVADELVKRKTQLDKIYGIARAYEQKDNSSQYEYF